MKLSQVIKSSVIPVLALVGFLSTSSTALADYLSSEGIGGNYRYELWSSDNNNGYYLKIWLNTASPKSNPSTTTRNFSSTREALIYFDCNYADRKLPECSQ